MSAWLAIFAAGLVTYLTRLSFISLFGNRELHPLVLRALRFVPPAVLTAIIIPELLVRDGGVDISLGNGRLLAGLVAILVAYFTKNVMLTILVGMGALLLYQWVF